MKTTKFLLFFAVFALAFVGCDDDDGGGGSNSLEGLWNVRTSTTTNCNDPADNEVLDLTNGACQPDGIGGEICTEITMNFMSNGTLVFSFDITSAFGNFSTTETFTYTTSGNELTICDGQTCDTGTYSISGGILTVDYTDPADGCDSNITAEK